MPGRVKFKRVSIVTALLASMVLLTACAGADHTWRGEFDARLEGSAAAVERYLPELQPTSSEDELLRAGTELGRRLLFKDELIAELDPPAGCELVQQKGKSDVYQLASLGARLLNNMTPYLEKRFTAIFEESTEELESLEGEAADCATG